MILLYASEEGKKAAEIMQESLLVLDDTNHRKAKANDTYYLLKRTESPTIIVRVWILNQHRRGWLIKAGGVSKKKSAEAIVAGIKAYMEK